MIKFENKFYIYQLCFVITALLLFNLYVLIIWGALLSLIPISIQIIVLSLLFLKNVKAILVIKIWVIIMLVGGIGGWINILSCLALDSFGEPCDAQKTSVFNFVQQTLLIAYPIYVLVGLKSIKVATPDNV